MKTNGNASETGDVARLQARIAELESRLKTAESERDAALDKNQWWERLSEASSHFVSVFDEQLHYCYLNHRAEEYTDAPIVGQPLRDFVAPQFVEATEAAYYHTLQTGESSRFKSQDRVGLHWYENEVERFVMDDGRRYVFSVSRNIDQRIQTETDLRDAQSLWNSLVANSPDTILLLERDAKILYINRTSPGYKQEDLIGHYGFEFVLPEYKEAMRVAIVTAVDTGKPQHYEMRDVINRMWWWITLVPVRNDTQTELVLAISQDVSERRNTELALHESETRLRMVLSQTPAIVWTVDCDENVLSADGAGLQLVDMEHQDWRGKSLAEMYQSNDPEFPPLAAHRAALLGESGTYDQTIAGIHFHNRVEPLRDSSGKIVGALGVAVDVSARKQSEDDIRRARDELEQHVKDRTSELDAVNRNLRHDIAQRKLVEKQLRDSEERFRIIAETVPVAVVITRRSDGLIRFANHRAGELVGLPRQALFSRQSSEFYYDPADRVAILDRLAQSEDMVETELQLKRNDGSPVMVNVSYQPITYDGDPAILTGLIDITRRMDTEQALRSERRLLKRLLDLHERDRQLISYEIHDGIVQDMTASLMFLESSRPPEDADASVVETFERGVKVLRESINEARRLINGLRPPVLEDEGVVAALEALIEDIRDTACMDIEFHSDVSFQRLAPALEMAIYRIVQEGLNNVWHHSRSKRARVDLVQQDDSIAIVVQDWGIGFDPTKVSKRRYGLMGVRERARLLNGHASLDTKIGAGTTLRVELPLTDALMPSVE